VCADNSSHALQIFQHSVLALYPDGSGSNGCHARPCRPWAECLSKGVCSIAGSLWTVQSVLCCCLIAARGLVANYFKDPIAGLGELVNIRVWFLIVMLDERGGHVEVVQVEWKFNEQNSNVIAKFSHFESAWATYAKKGLDNALGSFLDADWHSSLGDWIEHFCIKN